MAADTSCSLIHRTQLRRLTLIAVRAVMCFLFRMAIETDGLILLYIGARIGMGIVAAEAG